MIFMVVDCFGDGSDSGINIRCSIEDVSFETGKRIKDAKDLIHEHFLHRVIRNCPKNPGGIV